MNLKERIAELDNLEVNYERFVYGVGNEHLKAEKVINEMYEIIVELQKIVEIQNLALGNILDAEDCEYGSHQAYHLANDALNDCKKLMEETNG